VQRNLQGPPSCGSRGQGVGVVRKGSVQTLEEIAALRYGNAFIAR
jgi:hypothetical protein